MPSFESIKLVKTDNYKSNSFYSLKKNETVEHKGKSYRVLTYQHSYTGKDRAVLILKALGFTLITGIIGAVFLKPVRNLWKQGVTGRKLKSIKLEASSTPKIPSPNVSSTKLPDKSNLGTNSDKTNASNLQTSGSVTDHQPSTPPSITISKPVAPTVEITREQTSQAYSFIRTLMGKYLSSALDEQTYSDFMQSPLKGPISEANQTQLLNYARGFSNEHGAELSEWVDRWKELESKGEIHPPSSREAALYLKLNLKPLSDPDSSPFNANCICDNREAYRELVQNWNSRESDEEYYELTKFAEILGLSPLEADALCSHLQIRGLDDEHKGMVASNALDYYFSLIDQIITGTKYNPVNDIVSQRPFETRRIDPLSCAKGESNYAFGNARFPGIMKKAVWTIDELAQYLAVEKDDLINKLADLEVSCVGNTYQSEDLAPKLKDLFNSAKGLLRLTQADSIRYAVDGRVAVELFGNFKFPSSPMDYPKAETSTYLKNYRYKNSLVFDRIKDDGRILSILHKVLKDDYDVALAAVEQNPQALQYASERLRGNYRLVQKALEKDFTALQFASDKLKDDERFILALLNRCDAQNKLLVLQYASKRIQEAYS